MDSHAEFQAGERGSERTRGLFDQTRRKTWRWGPRAAQRGDRARATVDTECWLFELPQRLWIRKQIHRSRAGEDFWRNKRLSGGKVYWRFEHAGFQFQSFGAGGVECVPQNRSQFTLSAQPHRICRTRNATAQLQRVSWPN